MLHALSHMALIAALMFMSFILIGCILSGFAWGFSDIPADRRHPMDRPPGFAAVVITTGVIVSVLGVAMTLGLLVTSEPWLRSGGSVVVAAFGVFLTWSAWRVNTADETRPPVVPPDDSR